MKLTPDDLPEWLARFFHFNDAVVRHWHIHALNGRVAVEVEIETKDGNAASSGWSRVTLNAGEVYSLNFTRSNKSDYDVLSNGLHVLHEEGSFGLEFGDFVDAPTSIGELMSSPCHVAAISVEWSAAEIIQ